ncbi:MAG TPA: choice-of-anchor Q domain-containing protein [Acidimicrobiales bacterium]|nr:choice-of-anchor Q domain-containing protein [Acidimicrobiales bacterium]
MGLRTGEDTSAPGSRSSVAALVVGIVALSLTVPAGPAGAVTPAVTNCNSSGTGSLTQAVRNAASGDTITFALSPACSTITLSRTIDIVRHLSIDGPGPNALSVSGHDAVEVFRVDPRATATISGLTIENGNSPNGGGIANDGTLNVTDSTLTGNSAATGGGGIWNNGTLNVTDSTFTADSAGSYGGAIYSGSLGVMTVEDSSLSNNSATALGIDFPEYAYGGGIYAYGTAKVADSSLSDNAAVAVGGGGGGGGVYVGGTLSLTGSTLAGNRATVVDGVVNGDGGGAILNGGTLTVSDSTVSHNSTNIDGGGIANGWTMRVADSTVTDNGATTGGGIFNDGGLTVTAGTVSSNSASSGAGGDIDNQDGGTVSAAATVVADSTSGSDCSGGITDAGDNLDGDGSCGFTASTDHPDTPAGLDPGGLQDHGGPTQTIALEAGSAAIGAVSNASLCSTPDQRGVSRPTPCDIGAAELVVTGQTIVFASTPPPDAVVGGPSYSVSATGGASGNPVLFSVDATASSVCSISGSTVSFIGPGTCVLDANQAGNATYGAAVQVQQSFRVAPQPQVITSSDAATARVGSPFSFTVTTTGVPVPAIASKRTPPKHLALTDNGNGTATMAGIPAKAGIYHFTITATFGKARTKNVVSQPFTLTVDAKSL